MESALSVRGTAAGSPRVPRVLPVTEREGDVMRTKMSLLCVAVAVCLVSASPLYLAAPAAALSFAPPAHYDAGGAPAGLASADLNGDGLLDLVASAGDGIAVLLGCGLGRFAPATRISLEHQPRGRRPGGLRRRRHGGRGHGEQRRHGHRPAG